MRVRQLLVATAVLTVTGSVEAQSPRGKAEATIAGKAISVDYGRPSLQGRDMLSKAPAGTVWRLGADQATTIESESDLIFGETTIPAGSYSLFAKRVDESNWELIFNKQTGQWGTQRDPEQDLASVPLEWAKTDDSTEQLTIELAESGDSGEIHITWGKNVLKSSFKVS